MTSSPKPWTTRPATGQGAWLVDASGKTIGLISDYRDADLIVQAPDPRELEALYEQVEDLEEQLRLLAKGEPVEARG